MDYSGTDSHRVRSKPTTLGVVCVVVFIFILGLVVLLGGSSRADQPGLLLLRPAALIVASFAALIMTREQWKSVAGPTIILAVLVGYIAIQLVPLPPALWSLLPGREEYLGTYAALGQPAPWLPISQSPARTWNALVSLAVPLGIVLAYGLLPQQYRRWVPLTFVVIGLASALLGALQLVSGGSSALYFYSIANFDSNTGFFANRNHQAVFLAAVIMLIPAVRQALDRDRIPPYFSNLLSMAVVALLTISIVTTGSRIGVLVGALAAIWAMWTLYRIVDQPSASKYRRPRGSFDISARVQKLLIPGGFAILAVVAALSPQSLGLTRIFAQGAEAPIEDMRVEIFKNSLQMLADNMPFGGGAGTFADIYRGYEMAAGISYRYVNHAHDDALELAYELGIPGILLVIVVMALVLRWVRGATSLQDRLSREVARSAILALSVIVIGSFFDYPARTPIVACFAMLALVWIYERYRKIVDGV